MSENETFRDLTDEESVALADRLEAASQFPLHRTEAGGPGCSTCDGGGCPDCTDPA